MDILDNREKAIFIWIVFGIFIGITNKKIRKSFLSLVKAFFNGQLAIINSLYILYTILVVKILFELNIWGPEFIGDTIFWFFGVAISMVVNLSEDIKSDFFKSTLLKAVKSLIIIEFLVNLYVFHILIELILVPTLIFLGAIIDFASINSKYEQVEKFTNIIVGIFGFVFISYSIYKVATDFTGFLKIQNLYEFLLPIFFTILFLPFLYCLAVYISYEQLFFHIDIRIKNLQKNKRIKKMIVKKMLLSPKRIQLLINEIIKTGLSNEPGILEVVMSFE